MIRAIEIRDLTFTYRRGSGPALSGLSYEQREGETVALIGPSGAGKSSLIRCLNRIIPRLFPGDFRGEVRLFGEDIKDKRTADLAARVGVVLQDFESQLFSTSAELDVAFGPENLGLAREEITARIKRSLELVGLTEFRHRDPGTLSGGQKQRLAIATILALSPWIIALDEATTDLDPAGKREVVGIVHGLSQKGLTVLMVEHEPEEIREADRVTLVKEGHIVCDGPPGSVLRQIDLLLGSGVRPPDPPRVCAALGLLERPVNSDDAEKLLRKNDISFSNFAINEIREEDERERAGEGAELIRVRELTHEYPGGVKALRGVSLAVRSGEFIALVGQNGSGKTTLVSHLIGLQRPTSGSVQFDGQEVAAKKVSDMGREIGYVFQNPDHQIFSPRVFDEVAFGPRNYGLPEREVKQRVQNALEQVGLGQASELDPFIMTKGERQRVAVASILAPEPRVLILDEPTTGLDYTGQRAVMDMLAELNRAGRTVIIITHTLWLVAEYARRTVVMANGKIIADGPTRQILADADVLKNAALRVPEVTALSLRFGFPCLKVEEFKRLAQSGARP